MNKISAKNIKLCGCCFFFFFLAQLKGNNGRDNVAALMIISGAVTLEIFKHAIFRLRQIVIVT